MELCPYHNLKPSYEIVTAREEISKTYVDAAGKKKKYVLPRLDTHYFFCPKCRLSRNPAFKGEYSASAESLAASRWNKACIDEKYRLFKRVVETGS